MPGFSQKLFTDTISQPPPALEPQVIIQPVMTASAAPGPDVNVSTPVASVTQSAQETTDVTSLTTVSAAMTTT